MEPGLVLAAIEQIALGGLSGMTREKIELGLFFRQLGPI